MNVSTNLIRAITLTCCIAAAMLVVAATMPDSAVAAARPGKAKIANTKISKSGQLSVTVKKVRGASRYQVRILRSPGIPRTLTGRASKSRKMHFSGLPAADSYSVRARAGTVRKSKILWGRWSAAKKAVRAAHATPDATQAGNLESDKARPDYISKPIGGVSFDMSGFGVKTVPYTESAALLVKPVDEQGEYIADKQRLRDIAKDITFGFANTDGNMEVHDICTDSDRSVWEPCIFAIGGDSGRRLGYAYVEYDERPYYPIRATVRPLKYTTGTVSITAYYRGDKIGTLALSFQRKTDNVAESSESVPVLLREIESVLRSHNGGKLPAYRDAMSTVAAWVHDEHSYAEMTCWGGATCLKLTSEYFYGVYGYYMNSIWEQQYAASDARPCKYSLTNPTAGHCSFLDPESGIYWEAQGHD